MKNLKRYAFLFNISVSMFFMPGTLLLLIVAETLAGFFAAIWIGSLLLSTPFLWFMSGEKKAKYMIYCCAGISISTVFFTDNKQ